MLGIAPQLENDGSYIPSKIALKLATVKKTDYKSEPYQKYEGNKSKILVLFTEQQTMKMQNGTLFSTGNHPVEALVPMLHLQNAGFEFEIYTPTGKPVVFEMWAFPSKDNEVLAIYNELKLKFEKPNSLQGFVTNTENLAANYAAVFIPGGHGAMLGIPEDENVGRTLNWAHENNLYTISICHGPGALLATTLKNKSFIYEGYKMAVFPDSVDKMTPKIGYLPGQMPHGLSEKLKSLGANVVNTKADNTVCIDRNLITGASPLASNQLGKLAANTLLKAN
jgi:molecular chaperone Hsp31 and glyoxalase 3